jgi:hypothetical protein
MLCIYREKLELSLALSATLIASERDAVSRLRSADRSRDELSSSPLDDLTSASTTTSTIICGNPRPSSLLGCIDYRFTKLSLGRRMTSRSDLPKGVWIVLSVEAIQLVIRRGQSRSCLLGKYEDGRAQQHDQPSAQDSPT